MSPLLAYLLHLVLALVLAPLLPGIINRIKAQGAQIYEVEIGHGRADREERPSAVFSIRMSQKTHHEQVLASIAELESVITLDEI